MIMLSAKKKKIIKIDRGKVCEYQNNIINSDFPTKYNTDLLSYKLENKRD